jgi:hypothetical protein
VQVVGADDCGGTPFLSEDGAAIVNLNTLVPPNSGLQLNEAGQINDRGEITINATDASFNNHTVVLIPCDENHPNLEGCDYSLVDPAIAAAETTARLDPSATQHPPQSRSDVRHRMRGLQSPIRRRQVR